MPLVNLVLKNETQYEVAPQQVEQIIATADASFVKLDMLINAGAGVHLILPMSSSKATYNVEIGPRAQFTLSLLGVAIENNISNISIVLSGNEAKAIIVLAAMNLKESVTIFNIHLKHIGINTTGRINTRRVINDKALSELIGLLEVDFLAHGTDTYLSDKALLLGCQAQAKSDPKLEIKASDVKASHGATIGQINEAELFYLRSRGLPKERAEAILVQSFLDSVLIGVPRYLKQKIFYDRSIWTKH